VRDPDLLKLPEDALLVLRGNPRPSSLTPHYRHPSGLNSRTGDGGAGREYDGIADQVVDDLGQAVAVKRNAGSSGNR
jgi:hypothetical protein